MANKTKTQIAHFGEVDSWGMRELHLSDANLYLFPKDTQAPKSTRWEVYQDDKVIATSRKRKATVLVAVVKGAVYKVVLRSYRGPATLPLEAVEIVKPPAVAKPRKAAAKKAVKKAPAKKTTVVKAKAVAAKKVAPVKKARVAKKKA